MCIKPMSFVDVAEEVVAAIRGRNRTMPPMNAESFGTRPHYSLNQGDGIENDALNRPLTPEEILEQKQLREEVYAALMQLTRHPGPAYLRSVLSGHDGGGDRPNRRR